MGQMIKFEHGMLVLNSLMTKEDVAAINEFADYVRKQEQERIFKRLLEHAHDIPTMGACYENNRLDFILLPREDIEELITEYQRRKQMNDWITPDDVKNHHDNGYAAGLSHENQRILSLLRHWDSLTNDVNQFQDEMRRAHDIGFGYGEQAATERIIKLLEEHNKTYLAEEVMYCCEGGNNYWFQHAIALINGENK